MKILYVGNIAIPIKDILSGKKESQITGWPAYFQPVYKLIKNGHSVDFVMTSDIKDFNIQVDWFHEKQIIGNAFFDRNKKYIFGKYSRFIHRHLNLIRFRRMVKKAIKSNNYDFIYCQEVNGYWGNVYANKYNVPCGVRVYGDTFYHRGKVLSKYEFIQKHGIHGLKKINKHLYKLYRIKKSFMLTTADGTHGDLTYELLCPKKNPYDFYYWRTGVDKNKVNIDQNILKEIQGLDFVVYPARIDDIKRQDVSIDVLFKIHSFGHKIHLLLIGEVSNNKYYLCLVDKIKKLGLEKYVHFVGGVSQNQVKAYSQASIGALLTSDLSNRGNVFFELFSIGVPIFSFNDGSLNEYIINEKNGFLANNITDMAEYVVRLIENKELKNTISTNAIKTAENKVLSSDERFSLEIKLIEKYANGDMNIELPKRL